MAQAIKAARETAIGVEVTKGTKVAATRRLIVEGGINREVQFEEFAGNDYGVLARTARAPVPTRHVFGAAFTSQLDFQQILCPLLSGMKGGVTGIGTDADKTWTFSPSPTADPAINSYTVEAIESDGTNSYAIEAGYCVTTELGIRSTPDGLSELDWTMVGQKAIEATKTTGIAIPALEYAAGLAWSFDMNDTWATLGDTQVSGHVYGFDWRFSDFIAPAYYLDGRATLDFSRHEYKPRMVDLTLDLVLDAKDATFTRLEIADKLASTLRFARLTLTGATLATAAPYKIVLDGAYYHAADSLQEIHGGDRDGQTTMRMHLMSAYDKTAAKDVEVVVVNDVATFPA